VPEGVLSDTSTQQPGTAGRLRSPAAALVAVVLACFILTAAVSSLVESPRIFYDELIYMEAAASLADGDGLEVRDEPYAYGFGYPTVLAPLVAVAGDRETAYTLAKLLNALLFALTAVPVYLVARRVLAAWPSVAVAALSVAVPSTVYVTVVMTESLAYLTVTWALLAIVLALERPTVLRQLAAHAAIGVAILARPQFFSVYAAYLLALVLAHWLLPERGLSVRGFRMLWPTGAALALGAALFVLAPILRGEKPGDLLGQYRDSILRSYDLATLGKWLIQHAAGLELYLAVVPVAVSPIVLAAFFARSREGSGRHAALIAAFAAINAAALAVAAVVVTTQDDPGLEIDRLHDRYLFYVVPLWLVVLVWWIVNGAPRPRTATRVGIALAALLALVFPYRELDLENGVRLFSATGTAFPAAVEEIAGSTIAGAIVTLVVVGLLLLAVRRGAVKAAVWALVLAFALNSLLVWGRAFVPPEDAVFADQGLERRWVDERVPEGAAVTVLGSSCDDSVLERDSYFLTEFFNDSIGDVVDLVGYEASDARVDADGLVVSEDVPLEAEYVVAQPGARLQGTRIASGTAAGLALWEVSGPVRVESVTPRKGFCLELTG
jgi:Dolichyl-phosphate-mannose-protein mannosyltransferase